MPSVIVKKLNLFGYSWGLNGSSLKILLYKLVFLFAILLIWKNRNHVVFKGKNQNPVLAIEIKNQAMEYHLCASSSIDNPGLACCDGIFRDEHGHWIKGFARKIRITNSFIVELWGLRDGLLICSNCNFDCVEIEMYAKTIIDVLVNPNYVNNIVSSILDDCRQLISNLP